MFNQYVQAEQYFDAIRVLHMNPSQESQDNCLRSLVATLWDLQRTKSLVDLHYAELTDRVAELLEAKCRLMPLMVDNGFFEVVYAFYLHRYNYEHGSFKNTYKQIIFYFSCTNHVLFVLAFTLGSTVSRSFGETLASFVLCVSNR